PGGVERGVDLADGHVPDVPAVGAEDVLVRLVAGPEGTDLPAGGDVQHVHRVGRGGGDRDPGAVGRDGHVVGAVTRHREAPVDPAGGEVQGDDVGEAGPGDHHRAAVRGGVHVVDQLVVSLADAVADGHEVDPADRVGVDLCHPLLAVGDDVDPADLREVAAGRDDVGGAVPVVADEQHLPRGGRAAGAALGGGGGGRGHCGGEGGGDGAQVPQVPGSADRHDGSLRDGDGDGCGAWRHSGWRRGHAKEEAGDLNSSAFRINLLKSRDGGPSPQDRVHDKLGDRR